MDPSAWSEWGFAAAVTGVLLTGGGAVVKWLFKFVGDITKAHALEREQWACSHKSERSEWKQDLREIREDSNERLDRVCDALTMAINELADMDKKKEE